MFISYNFDPIKSKVKCIMKLDGLINLVGNLKLLLNFYKYSDHNPLFSISEVWETDPQNHIILFRSPS